MNNNKLALAEATAKALGNAEQAVERLMENYATRCRKKGGLVAPDLIALQIALMQGSLKIFLMLEHFGLSDPTSKGAARSIFTRTAGNTFDEFIERYDVYDDNDNLKPRD